MNCCEGCGPHIGLGPDGRLTLKGFFHGPECTDECAEREEREFRESGAFERACAVFDAAMAKQ